MKIVKIIIVIVLTLAIGPMVYLASLGGEASEALGGLMYPNSIPTFGQEEITFAPEDTHSWEGAIEGGINGNASDIEKAIYLFLLACYNERDLPYYSYFLNGSGSTDIGTLRGSLVSQSYRVVNNTIADNELTYHRLINYVTEGEPENLLKIIRGILNEGYQKAYLNDKEYKIVSPANSVGITSDPDEDIILGAGWNYSTLNEKKYDGKVDDWEDIDTAGMTQAEIDFAHRYKSRISIDLLVKDIVKSATLEQKTDGENTYWEGTIIIDTDVANADAKTIANLKDQTSGLGQHFNKFDLTFQVWDMGVFKFWDVEESWYGSIIGLSGDSESVAPCYYSYDIRDCDLTELFEEFELVVPTA